MDKQYIQPPKRPERKELSNNPVKMCHEISHLSRAHMRELRDLEDIAAPHGTRLVISFLAAGDGVTQLELVNATHLRAPSVSGILKKLEDNGFVERKRDDKDMRAVRVYLTDKGRDLDRRTIDKIRQVDAMALEGLTEAEKEQMMALLEKMRDNLLAPKREARTAEDTDKQ